MIHSENQSPKSQNFGSNKSDSNSSGYSEFSSSQKHLQEDLACFKKKMAI